MRLVDYLDKGASLGGGAPCMVCDGETLTYDDVVALTYRIGSALVAHGVEPGDKVAILASNDPIAFTCVFGLSRAGAVWCPINPRNEAAENRELLDIFDCGTLIFQKNYAPLVEQIRGDLPKITTLVCLDAEFDWALTWDDFLASGTETVDRPADDDMAAIVGTGGTTGRPKGVMLTGTNLETMSALTIMGYPWPERGERPVYLAMAPLTHAAGVLCLPVLAQGGSIVVIRQAAVDTFLTKVAEHRATHTFLPPTLIYMILDHPDLETSDLSSLQCFWYGAAPMSAKRLEEALTRIGPVMAQLFGQTEAPMMISMMSPSDHFRADGSIATERLSSAGRPAPLVTVALMNPDGTMAPAGDRGEIVVRSSLVMRGYYKNPEATAEAGAHGWHHTGDIGFIDDEGFLHIVDRAKDMVITGGFNVYSTEVEQALMSHPAVADCGVIGLPDEKWGERLTAVLQLRPGQSIDIAEVQAFVKGQIGSVKTPKQIEVWDDLPRSKVGKVLKTEIKKQLLDA
jgi:fatty-acyl-CoA synthase